MEKQYVLDEIARTAKENSGVALGHRRFAQLTGILEYDWKGRFWARWSDAVAEAGLNPNKLTSAYSEQFLLEKLIPKIEQLGRFPVISELRLFAYNEKGFPHPATFQRLGSKKQIAEKVLAHVKVEDSYPNTLAICRKIREALDESVPGISKVTANPPIIGFVYLLASGRNYKIGKTNAVGRRERELAIHLPDKATIIHQIPTDDPAGVETYWHRRFAEKRKNGEWFELKTEDIAAFKRRKYM